MKLLPLAAFAFAAGLTAPAVTAPGVPALAFPVACEPGRTCEVQHYVDRDPGPGTLDYRCGLQTYEGHNGVDIRLPDMAAQRRGVAVLAAAAGKVKGIRDGMADASIRAPGAASVANRECGNGVVIDHGGGWETQYCHMARGSIAVKVGDTVSAGMPLGRVGLSGNTEFPHLHFTVRHGGAVVDPFAPDADNPTACAAQPELWTPAAQARMPYHSGVVLNAGFTEAPFTMEELENGGLRPATTASPALIAYVRAIALLPGDVVELQLKGPDGATLAQTRREPLARWRAQDMVFIGKRRPPSGWASGLYTADYRVLRQGKAAISRRIQLRL
jgi:peptidase M23-like protein